MQRRTMATKAFFYPSRSRLLEMRGRAGEKCGDLSWWSATKEKELRAEVTFVLSESEEAFLARVILDPGDRQVWFEIMGRDQTGWYCTTVGSEGPDGEPEDDGIDKKDALYWRKDALWEFWRKVTPMTRHKF